MFETNIDILGKGGYAQGDMAKHIMNSGSLNVGSMRPFLGRDGRAYMTIYNGGVPTSPSSYKTVPINANAGTLRRDEWKQLDDAVMAVSRERLGGIDDLISKGLVYNLSNAMGTTVLEWHDVNDAFEANVTMDAVTRKEGDRVTFQTNYLPIPIISVDYEINSRVLAASRNMGNPLDTTSVEMATRRIREKLENMLFTDIDFAWGTTDDRSRNKIYSYLNHPDINLQTLAVHWDDSPKTGAQIVAEVADMKQLNINSKHFGPYMLYIPTNYETVLDLDYDASTPGTTIRERILKIDKIEGIKVIDSLPADHVLLVQMTSNVVRLVRGMGITNVEWDTEGKFITKYKVFTIQVPQIRSDRNGATGIVLLAE